MTMDTNPLHIFLLPLLAPGHMLPMVDMAKMFAEHGVKVTIVTTPINASRIRPSVDWANHTGYRHKIEVLRIQFPSSKAGLPDGWENLTYLPTPDVMGNFYDALCLLRQPFDQLLKGHRPDCILSDVFYPWTADSAIELGIPRLQFHGSGSFPIKATIQVDLHKPAEKVWSDDEYFVVHGLPHRIEMRRSQMSDITGDSRMDDLGESHLKSYGTVINSFHGLDADYVLNDGQHKTWYIGPLSLCNKDTADMAVRGDKASVDYHHCLSWLDNKEQNSVVYLCFGSLGRFTPTQQREIALALESLGRPFIWVLRDGVDTSEWLPEGFEEKIREGEKGLIIKGWAPQVLILNHKAVGGFLTHCGWNSCMEGISAGVPMITWPLFAEQFFNERLIVDVLRIGVEVGGTRNSLREEERGLVMHPRIEKAVDQVMGGGEEAKAMRKRVDELGVVARRAVNKDGSSSTNMRNLIEDLMNVRSGKRNM